MMLNFPPPPPPPIDASQLESLAEYYRQIVDYYRRASEIAANQLAHVEALLHPQNSELTFSSELESWLSSPETHQSNGSNTLAISVSIPQLSATAVIENGQKDLASPDVERGNSQTLEETFENTSLRQELKTVVNKETLLEILATELESNRGKMLHLDYLVRKLYGEIDSSELKPAQAATKKLLSEGTSQQKWFAVPDAPDCWTIDLGEFPDLSEGLNFSKKKQSHPPRTTLVGSKRLARYGHFGSNRTETYAKAENQP